MTATAEQQLMAITPIDGRYADKVEELAPVVSEFGLIRYRVAVEAGWLSMLGSEGVLPDVEPFSDRAQDAIAELAETFTIEDAMQIKAIETTTTTDFAGRERGKTNHDVKAVEYWIRDQLAGDPELGAQLELIHFGRTSEDINNLAIAMMLRDARDTVLLPSLEEVIDITAERADRYTDMPLLARTHGQPATPTTLGHEMNVFYHRLRERRDALAGIAIRGKLNGATGGFAADAIAYPEVNWPAISRRFTVSLGFEPNSVTTQIEPHDWEAELFYALAHGNNILTDLATDMWQYISMGHFAQRAVAGEVGSSAMPHKVNPIAFENAEANFGLANATLIHLADKLTKSRLQRDLSDSSAQRAIGGAFAHSLVGYKAMRQAFGRAEANPGSMREELEGEWVVLAEAVQTVMRRYRIPGAYDLIKQVTRGESLDEESYARLVMGIEGIPEEARERLLTLTPATYVGYSAQLARSR